jgi:hypothetical protein
MSIGCAQRHRTRTLSNEPGVVLRTCDEVTQELDESREAWLDADELLGRQCLLPTSAPR